MKETLNALLLLEKTRILTPNTNRNTNSQRPTHFQALSVYVETAIRVDRR